MQIKVKIRFQNVHCWFAQKSELAALGVFNNRVLQLDPRPMANNPNAMEQLQNLLRGREALYAMADHTIDTSALGLSKSVNRIVELYKK